MKSLAGGEGEGARTTARSKRIVGVLECPGEGS